MYHYESLMVMAVLFVAFVLGIMLAILLTGSSEVSKDSPNFIIKRRYKKND